MAPPHHSVGSAWAPAGQDAGAGAHAPFWWMCTRASPSLFPCAPTCILAHLALHPCTQSCLSRRPRWPASRHAPLPASPCAPRTSPPASPSLLSCDSAGLTQHPHTPHQPGPPPCSEPQHAPLPASPSPCPAPLQAVLPASQACSPHAIGCVLESHVRARGRADRSPMVRDPPLLSYPWSQSWTLLLLRAG